MKKIFYGIHEGPPGKFLIGLLYKNKKFYAICAISFFWKSRTEAIQEFLNDFKEYGPCRDDETTKQIAESLFDKKSKGNKFPVVVSGTPFQIQVWNELLKIPCGERISYGKLAASIGRPKAARAVGSAVGKNPIGFLIPCHRVVSENNGIGGYHWDIESKIALLEWETSKSALWPGVKLLPF